LRGQRSRRLVGRLKLVDGATPRGSAFVPGLVERLASGWLERRYEPHLARELARGERTPPRMPIDRAARGRLAPHSGTAKAIDTDHLESA
jgi:hypothetical protein